MRTGASLLYGDAVCIPLLVAAMFGQAGAYPRNAVSCERCHNVPGKFGGGAMAVQKTGLSLGGKFIPASEGGIHHRQGESAQSSAPANQITGERVSLTLLGDGYVEAIDSRDIGQNAQKRWVARPLIRQFYPVGVLAVALVLFRQNLLKPLCLLLGNPLICGLRIVADDELLAAAVAPKRSHVLEANRFFPAAFFHCHCPHAPILVGNSLDGYVGAASWKLPGSAQRSRNADEIARQRNADACERSTEKVNLAEHSQSSKRCQTDNEQER